MKILIFADASNSHTEKWLRYFWENGLDVEVVSLLEGNFQKYPNHILQSVSYRNRISNRQYNRHKVLREIYPQLRDIVKRVKPDILHAHYASSFGLYAAITGFHPFILTVWGSDITDFPKKNLLNRTIIKFVLSKADIVCSTSEYLADMTARYTSKEQELTYFGVDCEVFKPIPSPVADKKKFIFGTVKSLYKNYGINYLIEAAALLKEHIPDWELMIGGVGTEAENLIKLVHDLRIDNQVKFLGRIPHSEVPKIINSMDVFVVPSLEESFGVAAAEASACELPVIASDIGGLPEIVRDSETGYLVEPADPRSIAEKLLHLYHNPNLRRKMGKAGREHVKSRFDWKANAAKMLNIYDKFSGRNK